ncbi:SGNH/GDSL hydrolase family protein [Pajaroellobacter abortibovis]|uniref:SGNH/GDSL hydrolase family protein n=1 Tax=Pajaroellobacter abortibovis TaxID=1882918 RepID=UPI0012EB2BB8|nr:SGNH/GDSL hydrolase family protein [Pajaroellobacter abortibovis]
MCRGKRWCPRQLIAAILCIGGCQKGCQGNEPPIQVINYPIFSMISADTLTAKQSRIASPSSSVPSMLETSAFSPDCQIPSVVWLEKEVSLCERPSSLDRKPPLFSFPFATLLQQVTVLGEQGVWKLRSLVMVGQRLERNHRVFGVIGDSFSLSAGFLAPFGIGAHQPGQIDPSLLEFLTLNQPTDGGTQTVIEYFHTPAIRISGTFYDPFRAPRAAKNGARVGWAFWQEPTTGRTPVEDLIKTISPAYALVMLGTNDAASNLSQGDELIIKFRSKLETLVQSLENHGVIPILTTLPRHMRDPSHVDCSFDHRLLTNDRIAWQTYVLSRVIAQIACERHLPLMDLRYALEHIPHYGIAKDGVHLTVHPQGGGMLNPDGLNYGLNLYNFLALQMLKTIVDALLTS